jgi:uncharacterized protein
LFSQIKPKYGKYAITGNHEYFAGIEQSLALTRRAGFDILRDEVRQVAGITIVGIDDLTGRQKVPVTNNPQLAASLAKIHRDQFVLQLKHQPNVYDQEKFNLQLSGHTHSGQIFPFRLVTGLFFSHNYGYYELRQNKLLYVSGGAGTWGPPVRVFAPPEITVIDLIGKISNQ